MRIRKILAIMLIITIILGILQIPSARAEDTDTFTITFDANGAEFEDGSTTNTVTYDSTGNVISGIYKKPYMNNPDTYEMYWSYDTKGIDKLDTSNITKSGTVYVQYTSIIWNFSATGGEQTFISPITRKLKLETWGAAGGRTTAGYGGYSTGYVSLNEGDNLYINIGTQGKLNSNNIGGAGGYNGGGAGGNAYSTLFVGGCGGGGATHIATKSGLLSSLENYKDSILIVSGGGGGAINWQVGPARAGGSGGGFKGGNPKTASNEIKPELGATQTTGYAFGQGMDAPKKKYATQSDAEGNGGGGGGWYGGLASTATGKYTNIWGGGGSGYIGNELLSYKHMACYNGETSDDEQTKTISVSKASSNPVSDYAKSGDGAARISYVSHEVTVINNFDNKNIVYSVTHGESTTPEPHTERTGYNFNWYLDDIEFDFDTPITEDITLVGEYTPIIYNIETDNNNGELEEGTTNPTGYTIESEDITLNNPTKDYYEFEGWSEDDGTTKNENVTIPTGSIGDRSFKAYYKAIEYLIEYVLDGGTATGNPDKYTIESDDITLNNPTKEGYTFNGWTGTDLDTETLDVTIANGSTGNRTFTANWGINEYLALFYKNDGTEENAGMILKNYNEELGELPTATRTGYKFDGWFTDRFEGTQISSTTTMPAGDITYYAHWTPIEYTITFNSNTGTGSMRPQTHTYDEEKTLSENTFEKTGYTFIGWSTKEDGTGTNYTDKQNIKNLSVIDGNNINLYAQWRTTKYSITYDLGEGGLEEGKTNPIEYTVESDNITLNNPVPTKDGYEFTGWSGTGLIGNENTAVTIQTGSIGNRTYTANYTPIEYIIEYDLGIGSLTTSNPTTYNVETSTFTLNNPTSPDVYHYFVGWTTDKETEEDLLENYKIEKGTTGNIKLYAVFQTNPYTVTFVSDGEKVDEYVRRGAEPVGTLPTVDEKEYYGFMGWYVDGKKIDENFISRDNCTAVALWEYTHVHNLTLVPAKEPNCVEKGNKAYYVCSECGKWFEDATGLVEITDKTSVEIPIDPEAHDWGDWVIVKQPTTTEKGLKQRICKNDSSHIETEEIPTIVYEITGGDTEHEIGSGKDITTTTNGDIDELKEVRVDGKVVDPSNYTVDPETKTVTLKSTFLDTLAEGKHTLTLVFTNGEVSSDFEITKEQSTETKQETKSSNPLTGDNITKWTVTLAIATAMLYITSKKTKRLRRAKVKGKRFK